MGVANNEALAQEVPRQRGGGVLRARAPGKHDVRAEGSAGVGTTPRRGMGRQSRWRGPSTWITLQALATDDRRHISLDGAGEAFPKTTEQNAHHRLR
jgi:hypothetical protein